MTVQHPEELDLAIEASLESLLTALTLEPLGGDRFRATSERGRFDRLFGGQQLGQAVVAASATVEGKDPHSLHAYFVEGGTPEEPIDLVVERVRDGRSMSTRRVTLLQGPRTLLTAIASFHANPVSPEMPSSLPDAPHPDELPRVQDWVQEMPEDRRSFGMTWVDVPPPLDMRIGEPPTFLGGAQTHGDRPHWMRVPRPVGDDPALHAALLAQFTGHFSIAAALRPHAGIGQMEAHRSLSTAINAIAISFHGDVRADRWMLYHHLSTFAGDGMSHSECRVHDEKGGLVASFTVDAMIRRFAARSAVDAGRSL